MSPSEHWLNQTHDATGSLDQVADQLWSLGKAFNRIGNAAVADELYSLGNRISKETDVIRRANGDKISADYQQTIAATGNMIRAALAVSTKPEGSP